VLTDVEALTERILLMDHGRVLAHGGVHEVRDLLDRYPRHVRVATPDPRALGARLWTWPSVLSLEVSDQSVLVRTGQPVAFYEQLQDLLTTENVPFTSVTSPDDTVEAVFKYLVG
jgi:ABC-2 type transport system ATP-binding protein